jgi:hypothetical protein
MDAYRYAKQEMKAALDAFLAGGRFESSGRISFSIAAVDAFVAAMGFEARVMLRDKDTQT